MVLFLIQLQHRHARVLAWHISAFRQRRRIPFSSRLLSHYSSNSIVKGGTSGLVASATHYHFKGLAWLQDSVADVLNELYDPKDVARGKVIAQFEPRNKKKKKKKQSKEQQNPPPIDAAQIQLLVDQAIASAPAHFTRADARVQHADYSHGDFQITAAMGLAQALQLPPRECAQQMVDRLQPKLLESEAFSEPTIAGPGFVNLCYRPEYLQDCIHHIAADASHRCAIPVTLHPQRIVVDYSSPNIAKHMHVGHLRSTIIGDTLSNLLEFIGHDVLRLNHVGDWGTQFGMLVEHLRETVPEALTDNQSSVDLGDLVELYKAAKKRFDADQDFQIRARESVVRLQAGNAQERTAWESLCAASRVEFETIYNLLDIRGLQERGESFYNPYLVSVVKDLEEQGLAVESEGATAVFLPGYTNADNTSMPLLVRKSDGGFNYATTDLAAIRHRTGEEKADRILYVTDAGQAQHFEMVFETAKLAGFVNPDTCSLEHVPFGLVQGEDGKKFATRSGETIKLKDLLNEAVRIAGEDLRERNKEAASDEEYLAMVKDHIAAIVGIGAVKYADLSMNRESNYRFSYETMLSLNGNTAPYMLYAYARICGIIRKGCGNTTDDNMWSPVEWPEAAPVIISDESELNLMRNLARLPDIIQQVEHGLYPSRMCDYLFETSQSFNKFYENCPVNNAETDELRASRLTLCVATAGTLRLLLSILGIQVVEKM